MGSSTMMSSGLPISAWALPHASGEAGDRLVADGPEVGLLEQRLDHRLAIPGAGDALQDCELVEHRISGDAGINPEVLRQVAERPAQLVRLGEDIDVAEFDRARGRLLQRRDGAHERRFAGAVGAEQAVHPARDRQADVVESDRAVSVSM